MKETKNNTICCPVQTVQITGYANLPESTEINDNIVADDKTWSSEKIQQEINKAIPIFTGIIAPIGGKVAPDGWLKCNGQAVSREQYKHCLM